MADGNLVIDEMQDDVLPVDAETGQTDFAVTDPFGRLDRDSIRSRNAAPGSSVFGLFRGPQRDGAASARVRSRVADDLPAIPGRAWAEMAEAAPLPEATGPARLAADETEAADLAAHFDPLRNRLLQKMEANGWVRIAVAGPTRGCGATVVTAALALSFGRLATIDSLVVDLDLRHPHLAGALGVVAPGPLSAVFGGFAPVLPHLRRVGRNLGLVLNDAALADPVAGAEAAGAMLDHASAILRPAAVLCDVPPLDAGEDLAAVLAHVDAVLLVADRTRHRPQDIADCEARLSGVKPVLGVVLNRADAA